MVTQAKKGAVVDCRYGPPTQNNNEHVQKLMDALTHILIGLRQMPLDHRLPAARHILEKSGLSSSMHIDSKDLSNSGIKENLNKISSIKIFFENYHKLRSRNKDSWTL